MPGILQRIILLFTLCLPLVAQAFDHGTISYSAEGQASVSSGENTPFWLTNNRYGLSSTEKSSGYLRAGVFAALDSTDRKFKWSAGVDIAVPYRYSSRFVIQQAYIDLRYRCLGLLAGSKEMSSGFTDPKLSCGDLLLSNNSRPVPQLRFGLPEFTRVPGTKGWLSVKAHIAFGRFTDDHWQRDFASTGNSGYVTGTLYHSKSLFFRVSNLEDRNWDYECGLEMAAQFGGHVIDANGNKQTMPHSIKDYFRAIFALAGGSDSPQSDQANVYGNHLGNWIMAVNYRPTPDWHLRLYYQHFFEDHSMMFFEYPWKDGMIGLEIVPKKNPVVTKFVYEHLYTKFQSGSVYWDHNSVITSQISGRDNYYNHGTYNAWQHWGMAIGNPLLVSPVYNNDGVITFRHNRISAHHFGLTGDPCRWLSYRLLFSYTRSWGTYDTPTTRIMDNLNSMVELTAHISRVPGLKASLALAIDRGNMIGHNSGAMITITKSGIIK